MKKRQFSRMLRGKLALITLAITLLDAGLARSADWAPPIGIPVPSFGITTTHLMYGDPAYTYDFGSGPVLYPSTPNGPYTHYVDMNDSAATDTANPYGSPAKPRKTVPLNLPAGSVVEMHGGPYSIGNFNGNAYIGLFGIGTATNPIFIRGVPGALPTFSRNITVFGSYLILENLSVLGKNIGIRADLSPGAVDSDHLVFRHLTMKGSSTAAGSSAAIGGIGAWNDPSKPKVTNVLVWDNTISDYGDWGQAAAENDYIGVAVDGYNASDVWIVDNEIFHMGGDSIRIGSNPVTAYPTYTSRRLYVGRNKLYDNHENALDIKGCYDAVVSQNEMFGAKPVSSDPGSEIPIHYKCSNIWVVFNKIHNATKGISCSDGDIIYLLSNVFYDCEQAIEFWSSNEMHIIGNTFFRFQTAISDLGSSRPHPLINNIFTGLTDKTGGWHVKLATAAANVSAMQNNLIFETDAVFRVYWGSLNTSLGGFQTATGKGQGCVLGDPRFVDASGGDFRLGSASAARDAGTSLAVYVDLFASGLSATITADLLGTIRPQGPKWDIGAYELRGPAAPSNLRVVPNP